MGKRNDSELRNWLKETEPIAKALESAINTLSASSRNPFETLKLLRDVKSALEKADSKSLSPSTEILREIEAECTESSTAFWSDFSAICGEKKWAVTGSTARRLVGEGLFIEQTEDGVLVEGLPKPIAPHAASVAEIVGPIIKSLRPSNFKPKEFLELLYQAHSTDGAVGERPIEEIFRKVVLLSQKPTFWKNPTAEQFTTFTRPMFRARLAEVLRSRPATKDSRRLALGTTRQQKEAWEIFSPGEGRVVQIGRINFVPADGGEE